MCFKITSEKRNNIDFLILKNNSNDEFVEIIPDYGATVNRFFVSFNGKLHNILCNDQDQEISANPGFKGRLLFPFNDMIPDATYIFNNKKHILDPAFENNPIAMHGFVHNKKFTLLSQQCTKESSKITLQIHITKDLATGYPFDIYYTVTYTLFEHAFRVDFNIKNNGSENAPISPGWHPYFSLNGDIDSAILKMNSEKYVEIDKELLPTRKLITCTDSQFDFNRGKEISSMDLDIALTVPSNGITHLSQNNRCLIFEQDPSIFKYVQLYVPEDRKSIAIEPVCGATNSFNFHELGVIALKPQETIDTFAMVRID